MDLNILRQFSRKQQAKHTSSICILDGNVVDVLSDTIKFTEYDKNSLECDVLGR